MRKKFIDQVYMREVTDKIFHVEKDEEFNGYIGIKYVKKISKQITYFCNGRKYVGLDDGYAVLEYLPLNRGYNCRVFFDRENRPILFYFDINNGCGIENGIPWYDDLYLDVIVECPSITGGFYYIRLDDEIEFKNAYREGVFNDFTYSEGYDRALNLMEQLRAQKNDIVDRSQFDLYRLKEKLGLK